MIERGHAEILFAQITRVDGNRRALNAIDRFAVTTGPGTFTGVRIGLSAARGFALAAARPLIGINSLEVIARRGDGATGHNSRCGVRCKARRALRSGFQSGQSLSASRLLPRPRARRRYSCRWHRARRLRSHRFGAAELAQRRLPAAGAVRQRSRAAMRCHAPACLVRLQRRARIPASDRSMPLYLRAPDAKLPAPRFRRGDDERGDTSSSTPAHGELRGCAARDRDLISPGRRGFRRPPERYLALAPWRCIEAEPCGLILIQRTPDEAEVLTLVVAAEHRRTWRRPELMEWAIEGVGRAGCARILLEVSERNEPARAALRYARL